MSRYGFVEYEDESSVQKAIKEMNGKNVWGDGKITVESAFVKQDRNNSKSWQEYQQQQRDKYAQEKGR